MHGQRRSRSSQIGALAKAISSATQRQQLDRVCTVEALAFADDALPHAVGAGTLAPCIERGQRELEALDRQRPGYLDGGREGVKERCSCSWASLRAQSPEFTISRLHGAGLPRPRASLTAAFNSPLRLRSVAPRVLSWSVQPRLCLRSSCRLKVDDQRAARTNASLMRI